MLETVVIQTSGLGKTFGAVQALKPLDLTVSKNSIFGFLGPNGAGKTTTIKLLLGLISPTAGSATVFGLDIIRNSVEIRSRIGYLPQEPHYYEYMTARQTLDFTARFFFKGPDSAIQERVAEMLDLVGLEDKADRPIKGFSGGERQRLGIAQAQVNYPDLLILDEPAASLDPLGRRDVLEVMERLRKHTTIFYSTHILDDVQRVSDTVAILNHGELVAYGQIEELLAGSGGITYTISFKGDAERAHGRVVNQVWVKEIKARSHLDETIWTLSVSDEAAAESQILRLLLSDENLMVTEFRHKAYDLEEIFVGIVEGEKSSNDKAAGGKSK
ncbi:MAG: ABC transporter ATP-binding protein [Anaerolineales bacterium]|nr:ABC transporter ATP-binding protein [Anaerolineales bacterium]